MRRNSLPAGETRGREGLVKVLASRMAELARICRSHSVALLYLFGSQAELAERVLRSEAAETPHPRDPLADADVGVVMKNPLPDPDKRRGLYSALYNDLVDLFPGLNLDLVFLEEGHAVFQAEALMGRCVYAASERFRESYEHRVLARAADFRPVLERFYKERFEEGV